MSMLLKEIYDRDIYRDINPAVVVSDKREKTIAAEINEYVFTDKLIEKFYKIVNTVLNKRSGKAGIWINGYYGSGKSHFIKYVHYLLSEETSSLAFDAFEKAVANYSGDDLELTMSNVKLLRKRLESSRCDNIMFNAGDETDEFEKNRFTRIFLNMFNKFRGYNSNDIPLALLVEKKLDEKGQFEAFKKKIESDLGHDWGENASQIAAFQLGDILAIAKEFLPDMDIESVYSKLTNPELFKIGINASLIPELKNYLEAKDKDYRLLFLVDEVSQYVGSDKELLLNLQNIVERISSECNNQVWIACTAQQKLDEVSAGIDGVQDIQDEFGKILGRFDTRISLQSNDAAYITKRRVLDKNSIGIGELAKMHSDHKDYIENQFKISHELYKGYESEDDFIISYPFVPYQFKLISDVFDAFQQLQFVIKEVKDNERSVLGITHFTAKEHAEDTVGGFIPFDAFYNRQFNQNLTNRGAKAIQNAMELSYVKTNPFAARVVKVLFMISNLLESQRQTFPSNIENLSVLLMDKLDQNKLELKKEITKVLEKLIEESIIREDNGSYFFFNEDEMDVQNLIKSVTLRLDDRLTYFDQFFRPMAKLTTKFSFGQNDFTMGYSIEGKEIFRGGNFNMLVLLTDKTNIDQKALEVGGKDIVICINEWFNEDESLRKDFDWYCKTNRYLENNSGASGERSRTIENFKVRNNQLKARIEQLLLSKFSETRFVSQNLVVDPDQINGTSPSDRIKNLIEYSLGGIYKNIKLAENYAKNSTELKKSALSNQIPIQQLTPAETQVNDMITANNNQMNVDDLVKVLAKEPFGWRTEAVLDILIQLVRKKKRDFRYKTEPRYPIVNFIDKAISSAERSSCEVGTGEEIDSVLLDKVKQVYKTVFNENFSSATTDGIELFDALSSDFSSKRTQYQELEREFFGKYPFGECFRMAVQTLNEWYTQRDPKRLFELFIESETIAKELFDKCKSMNDFVNDKLKDYDMLQRFVELNKENFKELEEDDKKKAHDIQEFLTLEDPLKQFRIARKAYDELEAALKSYSDNLREKVVKAYERIFDQLEKDAKKFKVDASKYANKEMELSDIRSMTSIAQLKTKLYGVDTFKSAQLEKIVAAKPKKNDDDQVAESATVYLTKNASLISTEEEMEAYLKQIREEMTELLKQKKTIILK